MANIDNPKGFRFVKTETGGSPVIKKVLATDSQTIAAGDAVIKVSGKISIAATTSASLEGIAVKAAVSSTSNTTVYVEYIPANPLYVFEGQCSGTYAQSIDGTAVDLEGTTGIMEVNENATTEKVLQIIELAPIPGNAIGLNSRVHFTIPRSTYTGLEDDEA